MTARPIIVWLRRDLRLSDNPALAEAALSGAPVIPVHILEDDPASPWRIGAAAKWWLHHSLTSVSQDVASLGNRLILRRGSGASQIAALITETNAQALYINRAFEPAQDQADRILAADLRENGIEVRVFNGSLLFDPESARTKSGQPFKVFTPFWRHCLQMGVKGKPRPAPDLLQAPADPIRSDTLESWDLLPTKPNWAKGFSASWHPGEGNAQKRLEEFIAHDLADYKALRDFPAKPATSRLSPFLHFGEISARQIWHRIMGEQPLSAAGEGFLRQLAWRDFSYHLLLQFPDLPEKPLIAAFNAFEWQEREGDFHAWTKGLTGYPIVDAGMRELWQTGWMHNRVRMIAASFLIKDLLIPWQKGETWFWDTLLDADLANNAAGWQWVAGSGADAAPYFRIFNPLLQSKKFDPQGVYLRRWLPELRDLPDEHIHAPFLAPAGVLAGANVSLGRTYPRPIVDHEIARHKALEAYGRIKDQGGSSGETQ